MEGEGDLIEEQVDRIMREVSNIKSKRGLNYS